MPAVRGTGRAAGHYITIYTNITTCKLRNVNILWDFFVYYSVRKITFYFQYINVFIVLRSDIKY